MAAPTIVGPVQGIFQGLPGGLSAAYGVTGAQTIKNGPGVLCQVIVTVAGVVSLQDGTNVILSLSAATVGQVVELNWPCATNISSGAGTTATLNVSFT